MAAKTGTYTLINSNTLGSAASSVTFSSIPGTYTDLILVAQLGQTTTSASLGIQFNSDTTSNYSFTELYGTGTTAASARASSQPVIYICYDTVPDATLNNNFICNIIDYSNSTTYKTVISRQNNPSSAYPGTSAVVGLWRSTAAITSVLVKPAAGNLLSGSSFKLYGIEAAK
jgi:hypothetical protein